MTPTTTPVALRCRALLSNPRFNKGTAFTEAERHAFGLIALLPSSVNTLETQCHRAYLQLQSNQTDIAKNSFLQSLKDQNWVLFYALLRAHLTELTPIIYTPTEAEAIANYSHLFRRSEGLYLSFPAQDTMENDFLEETVGRAYDLIVCSDGEAILGIGDQGVGAIGISGAKSLIYTLIAGIDPSKCLAIALDVGTHNQELLQDDLYIGWRHDRIRGEEYDKFMDKFLQLVRKYYPHSLLHFEDFGVTNAERLLERYRDQHSCFNDDIQGTGAVTLAAVLAALRVTQSDLIHQRIIVYGAGSAGLGVASALRDAMASEAHEVAISVADANAKFWLIDKYGLIKESLGGNKIRHDIREFVRRDAEWEGVPTNENGEVGLLEVIKHVKPTILIGTSTNAGGFTKEVIEAMTAGLDGGMPIILPLSNPSRLVEVHPKNAFEWSKGKALIATGSPFGTVKNSAGTEYVVAECNNALIYPGLGFGALLAKSRTLSHSMIIAGTERLASLSPALKDPKLGLLPEFADAPDVNFEVGVAVAERAFEEGIAGVTWSKEEVRKKAEEMRWHPVYSNFVYDEAGEK